MSEKCVCDGARLTVPRGCLRQRLGFGAVYLGWQKEERVNAALPLYRVYFLIRRHLRERTGHQRRIIERKGQS
jgi:hypothetical protein